VFDRTGRLALERQLDGNGFSPGLRTVPDRTLAPHGRVLVFNPFYAYANDISIGTLRVRFDLQDVRTRTDVAVTTVIRPVVYRDHALFKIPLRERFLVQDGHDFYAHHRRLDYLNPIAEEYRIGRDGHNFMRYAADMTPIDADGQMQGAGGKHDADYVGWNAPVYAAASGLIVAEHGAALDNEIGGKNYFDPRTLLKDPLSFWGNYVVIDHGNPEFTLYGHLRHGSIRVRVARRVRLGERIGNIGASGSANNPHLHFELQNGPQLDADGMPVYFTRFHHVIGATLRSVQLGPIDTGQIIEP